MVGKTFDEIAREDLEALVANERREGRVLDYKRDLPGDHADDKKEFLADVSSFANASGGDLIFGVSEDGGIPTEANGVAMDDVDKEIQRLDNVIRDGLEPRVPGVTIKPVDGFPNGPVLVMRVPKSWAAPHMVTFRDWCRFYSRNNAGKYLLDVGEIRSAFALSDSLAERIRNFRSERLGRIVAGETPVPLMGGSKVVLHLVPAESMDPARQVDLTRRAAEVHATPLYANGYNQRYNLDGVLNLANVRDSQESMSYLQIFRNGIFETVDSMLVAPESIPSVAYEQELMKTLGMYLRSAKDLELSPPYFVLVSFLGVKGKEMAVAGHQDWRMGAPKVDRDMLVLPDVMVEDPTVPLHEILRPVFDAVWQAVGWKGSINYDEKGEWIGNRRR